MFATVVVITLFCLGVGLFVLQSNPRRFANQAFAVVSLFATAWMACVAVSIRLGMRFAIDGSASPIPWLRANGAITSFLPWLTFILNDAVCANYSRRKALWRSLPLLIVGAAVGTVCLTDSYIPTRSTPMVESRGHGYFALCLIGLSAMSVLLVHTYRRMRQQTGIRRVEMTFLTLNFAITFPLVVIVTSVGNMFNLPWCRRSSFLIILCSFALSGWALTFHRVYNARQIVVSLAQRLVVVGGLACGIWAAWQLLARNIPSPADLCIAVAICGPIAFWFDNQSRAWLDLNGERRLAAMRATVIDLSRTEPSNEQLAEHFERLIAADCCAPLAALLIDRDELFARGSLEFRKGSPAFLCLVEMGWATPETLDRRRPTSGSIELQRYMAQHALGLIMTVPHGTPTPSLLVALGIKKTGWPFTYPEVQRIREISAMVDNILVRSRLVAEEGLKAKVEHLAMMSRGLAHDLKNLITPISSFLVHTHGQYPDGSAEEEVHNAARRSVAIIGDYVSEALFFAKRLTPKYELVDLGQLMIAVVEITATRAARRGVAVVTSLERRAGFVADGVLIQRLLVNLANNAIDASAAGTNVVLASTEVRAGWVRLEVRDDGVGIPPEHTERIFEPYFTTKQFGDDVRGFGLGLTICDKIVALHRGTIAVRSQFGIGTTVTVDLPKDQMAIADLSRELSGLTRPPFVDAAKPAVVPAPASVPPSVVPQV